MLKKEQQLKADHIREEEEVKIGFHSHLNDALQIQKSDAEKNLKDALAAQVTYIYISCFLIFYLLSFIFHFLFFK